MCAIVQYRLSIIFPLLIFLSGCGANPHRDRTPAVFGSDSLKNENAKSNGLDTANLNEFFAWPAHAVVKSYRKALGKGIKSTCPMYPSCSTFGLHAIENNKGFSAYLAIADRLNRCAHDTHLYEITQIDRKLLFLDPFK